MDKNRNRILCPEINRRVLLFHSRERAENFIRMNYRISLARNDGQPPVPYICKACGGWHITTSASAMAFNYNSTDRKRERELFNLVEDFYRNFKNAEYDQWIDRLHRGLELLPQVELTCTNYQAVSRARRCLKEYDGAIRRALVKKQQKQFKDFLTKVDSNFAMLRELVSSGRVGIAHDNADALAELLDQGYAQGILREVMHNYEVQLESIGNPVVCETLQELYAAVAKYDKQELVQPDIDHLTVADELDSLVDKARGSGACELFLLHARNRVEHFRIFGLYGFKGEDGRQSSTSSRRVPVTPNEYESAQLRMVRVKLAEAMTALQKDDVGTARDKVDLCSILLEEVRPMDQKVEVTQIMARIENYIKRA